MSKKDDKAMYVITGLTIREIVKTVNDYGITKEDIVSLIKDGGQYILTYFA